MAIVTTPWGSYDDGVQAGTVTQPIQNANNAGSNLTGDYFDRYDNLFDKQFSRTKDLMSLTNQFREKEGATQSQMDAQAFKRLGAELETRKYMQTKGQELTDWQRDRDQGRAMRSFKTIGN
jgi:hypothetical protein